MEVAATPAGLQKPSGVIGHCSHDTVPWANQDFSAFPAAPSRSGAVCLSGRDAASQRAPGLTPETEISCGSQRGSYDHLWRNWHREREGGPRAPNFSALRAGVRVSNQTAHAEAERAAA